MNAKLKLKSNDNNIEIDNVEPEKSNYFLFIFWIIQMWVFFYYLFLLFIVPKIDDQMFTLEPLADHVSFTFLFIEIFISV